MAEESINDKELHNLQAEVMQMRKVFPKVISAYMKSEAKMMRRGLTATIMELDNNPNIDFKKANKSYVKNAILETSVKPANFLETQIELNAKADTLLQCIEYLKK